jgi:hypothetical protein
LSKATAKEYEKPLFSRWLKNIPPIIISIRYRSHSLISGSLRFRCCLWRRKVEHGSSENHAEEITIIAFVTDVLDLGIAANDLGTVTFDQTQVEQIAEASAGAAKRSIIGASMVDAFQGDERQMITATRAKTIKTPFIDSSYKSALRHQEQVDLSFR